MRQNYCLLIQYDGTRYSGWQRQGNTGNTIQEKLEAILEKLSGLPCEVHGSGRTDGGVHAFGQTANFHLDTPLAPDELMDYINRYLPADIAVRDIALAPERFHSRLQAVSKTYDYRILTTPARDVFGGRFSWPLGRSLDIAAMRASADQLTGTHDFIHFCDNKRMKKSTVRTITAIDIRETCRDGLCGLLISYTGDGFLYHMVRRLTGCLVQVGSGKLGPQDMEALLLCGAPEPGQIPLAPACGLMLRDVSYATPVFDVPGARSEPIT